jgi:hypothetical protein
MLRLTPIAPPAHSVDDIPTWIAGTDPAWNIDLIKAHRELLGEKNIAAHPVEVYYSGSTRFSLDAKITMPEVLRGADGPHTVTVEHYLLPGKRPTLFEMAQLGARDWAIARRVVEEQGFLEFARRGLVRVRDAVGEDGKPATITPPRNSDGILDEWLDDVSKADRNLLGALGMAVHNLSQNEVAVAEGKP